MVSLLWYLWYIYPLPFFPHSPCTVHSISLCFLSTPLPPLPSPPPLSLSTVLYLTSHYVTSVTMLVPLILLSYHPIPHPLTHPRQPWRSGNKISSVIFIHQHMYAHLETRVYTCTDAHMHACTQTHICIYRERPTHTHTHTHAHTHTHTHTHTHMHTHTHTHTNTNVFYRNPAKHVCYEVTCLDLRQCCVRR